MRGSGTKTILFLHGWGGSTDSFLGLENRFIDRYKCINLDFPPFGKSHQLKQPFSLDDYYNIANGILEVNGITEVYVVAHSFGGRVAINLAVKTQKVKKLVITGGAGIKPKQTLKKRFAVLKYKIAKNLVKMGALNKNSLQRYGSTDYKALDQNSQKTFVNIVNNNQKNMLQYINAPTVLIWGQADTETPIYMGRIFNRKIKDSALVEFKGCGHFCYLERFNDFYIIVNIFFEGEN